MNDIFQKDPGTKNHLPQKEGFFDDYKKNSQKLNQLVKDWENTIEKLSQLKE